MTANSLNGAPYSEISSCRVCGSDELIPVLSLGTQALTGVFPKSKEEEITQGPLDLVRCASGPDPCGLVQLAQTYDKNELYGSTYGYHSSLNLSMVKHLQRKVEVIETLVSPREGDLVIDIGSNDGTLLKSYQKGPTLLGVDPSAEKFAHFYPEHIALLPDFFSLSAVRNRFADRQAKVITSIAMFYDLDKPLDFMREVRELLADDGIWVLEQSYLPSMMEVNAYDTICHEHIEYYGLRQIKWMTDRAGLRIVDVELNAVNGGSFSVVVAKKEAQIASRANKIRDLLDAEQPYGQKPVYDAFREAVIEHRDRLREFFFERSRSGDSVLGYGASTKGNVILQFCGITEKDLPAIGEVNPEKFGSFTPGTHIPIVSESEIKSRKPDYLVVFPWHFKDFFLQKEQAFLDSGGRLFFPLPSPTTI